MLLYKLLSIIPEEGIWDFQAEDMVDYTVLISDIITPYVRKNIVSYENLEKYEKFKATLRYFSKYLK